MHNILVTGATGFIGSSVVASYLEKGSDCVSLVRSETPFLSGSQITIEDFFELDQNAFQALLIGRIVYALGDPNIQGKGNGEIDLLRSFLHKLEALDYQGRVLLISSNAANPDSSMSEAWYRRRMVNDYIVRKVALENILLQSNVRSVILRVPAVIGLRMNPSSHIKRILLNRALAKILSLPLFRGTVEVITVDDLMEEIEACWSCEVDMAIFEPIVPAYRWSNLARHLSKNTELRIEKLQKFSRFQQVISFCLPITLRFLLFPHWVTKGDPNHLIVVKRHQSVISTIAKIRNIGSQHSKSLMVTGSASGLGAEVTSLLLEKGHTVLGIDMVPPEKSLILRDFLSKSNFQYLQGDLSSEYFMSQVESTFIIQNITGIFSIAGIGPRNPVTSESIEVTRKILEVNFFTPLKLARLLLHKGLPENFLCYVGSSAGIQGLPNFSSYSASKAALHAFFFSFVCEENKVQFPVLGVIPSGMRTSFQANNNVRQTSLDKFLLSDPKVVARYVVEWADDTRKKSRVRYFGVSAAFFLIIRNLPFKLKVHLMSILTKGTR
jgi:uncharacterized oxidoreductase